MEANTTVSTEATVQTQPDASPSTFLTGAEIPQDLIGDTMITEAPAGVIGQLPEDLQNEPSLRGFDSVDKLAKSYVNLVKKLGVPSEQLLRLPSEDADEESWNDIYTRLGRPEGPEGYDLPDAEGMDQFRQMAHSMGLTQRQAERMLSTYQTAKEQQSSNDDTEYSEMMQGFRDQITQEWGEKLPENLHLAQRAFNKFGDKDLLNFLNETGLGNHPSLLKAFHRIALEFGDDVVNDSSSDFMQVQDAKNEIQRLRDNESFMKRYWSGDPDAVGRLDRLYRSIPDEN